MSKFFRALIAVVILCAVLSVGISMPAVDVQAKTMKASPPKLMGDGAVDKMSNVEILATFEDGVDKIYNRIWGPENLAPHFWKDIKPTYNYEPVKLPQEKASMMEIGATNDTALNADNCNYWYVLPSSKNDKTGTADVIFQLNLHRKGNYHSFIPYQKLRIRWKGENSSGGNVNLQASAYNPTLQKWYDLGKYDGKGGTVKVMEFDLRVIPVKERTTISMIRFSTMNKDIDLKGDGTAYQKNSIYQIEVRGETPPTNEVEIGSLKIKSEYLGSLTYKRCGAYSASGFYDQDDGKYKVWFGGGIVEGEGGDNVYYIETTDPSKGWSRPLRVTLNDKDGKLFPANQSPGYGGDPAVLKIDGKYMMYFSALEKGTKFWNKIYLATSKDGITWDLYPEPMVNPQDGGTLGYGSGSPSVVYKDKKFYMYYYTQSENPGGGVLKISEDGYHFGESIPLQPNMMGDVKYIDSIKKWVMTYYTEKNQEKLGQNPGIRLAFSDDGIHWTRGVENDQMPAQDATAWLNHNPGFIGDPYGHGWTTMFMTFGVNDLSFIDYAQYDTRQLNFSRISIFSR